MNFPANPQDGDTYNKYIYNSAIGVWLGGPQAVATEFYVDAGLDLKIDLTEKGQVLGVASLDGSGSVPISQLSSIVDNAPSSLNTLGKVAGMFNLQSTEDWALDITVLPEGSVNVEGVTAGGFKVKIGNGTETWQQLEYVVFESDMSFYVSEELSTFEQDINQSLSTKADTSDVTLWLADKLDIADAQSTYALINSPTFSGTVNLPSTTQIGAITSSEIASLAGISTSETVQSQIDNIQDDVDTKAPIESPTFTGTVSGITSTMVGLGNVDNTSDLDKPVSTATQSALDLKANISGQVFTGDIEAPNLTITGDLLVQGTTTSINTKDYTVRDNMIYLNQAGLFNVTNAVGNGTTVTYTAPGHDYEAGDYVVITGVTPSGYNIAGSANITINSVSGDDFVVTKTDTGTYVSGGTARGKSAANPDLGFAAGYNDGTYHHAGFFRDASDGVWKVFDGYDPEPDLSVFINTADASFALADFQADAVKASSVVFSDGSIQTKAGVPSQTTFVYKTASYTLDSLTLADNIIEIDSTSATTVTIPLDSSVNYPVGTSIDILQTNTGQVTIAATGGVTLNGTPGFKLRTRWSSATILKRAANSWIVYGDLTA